MFLLGSSLNICRGVLLILQIIIVSSKLLYLLKYTYVLYTQYTYRKKKGDTFVKTNAINIINKFENE